MKIRNDRGFALIEVMIVLAVMALIMAIAIPGVTGAMNKAKITKAQKELESFSTAIEQAMLDNPKLAEKCGQTLQADGTYSEVDAAVTGEYITLLNEYLDESIKIDDDGKSYKEDPWGNKYEVYVSTSDMDYDLDAGTVGITTGTLTDTEIKIIIKSAGTNGTVLRTGTTMSATGSMLDDIDDLISVTQSVNGNIKTSSYGFKSNKGEVLFANDTDGNRSIDEAYAV